MLTFLAILLTSLQGLTGFPVHSNHLFKNSSIILNSHISDPSILNSPNPVTGIFLNQFIDNVEDDAIVVDALFDDPEDLSNLKVQEYVISSTPINEEGTESEPSMAQVGPQATAIAGPGGVAGSSPRGTAIVGKGGTAVASPQATAVAGTKDKKMKKPNKKVKE
ncbi:hypothetical protein ABEB36_008020 [Hypothenemus hampei]|uniref:DUF4774 domain-containing protein n=1 Tax=Hypothenemus hampei TaxID=57062 RepID=A0ABD1EKE9_HYPHA